MTDSNNAQEWKSFKRGAWSCGTDVADFIRLNCEPYEGDGAFLEPATERTLKIWGQVLELMKQERRNNGCSRRTCPPRRRWTRTRRDT